MKTMDDGHGLTLYKCPVCGGLFQARRALWGYWYGGAMVCSYHCMRELEKREEAGELAVTEAQGAEMQALYEGGASIAEIARQTGYSGTTVRDQLRRLGVYRGSREKKTEAPEAAPETTFPASMGFTPEEAQRIAMDMIPVPMGLTPEKVREIAYDITRNTVLHTNSSGDPYSSQYLQAVLKGVVLMTDACLAVLEGTEDEPERAQGADPGDGGTEGENA